MKHLNSALDWHHISMKRDCQSIAGIFTLFTID